MSLCCCSALRCPLLLADGDNSGEVDFEEFKDWYAEAKKRGRMPSFASALLRAPGMTRSRRSRADSIASQAAADQRSAMAMRSR